MKTALAIVFTILCMGIKAQDTTLIKLQQDTSIYFIRLIDGTKLSGKVISRTNSEIVFNDITIGKVNVPLNKIDKMNRLSENQYCYIETHDGKKFTGLIMNQNENEVVIKTESLGLIKIPNTKIKTIQLTEKEQIIDGKYFFPNPHPSRYFFGPSAVPLEKGDGYYQNIYIIGNAFQYGLSDHFSFGGGVVVPFFFFLSPKIGYKIGKNVYAGGGVMVASSFIPDMVFGLAIGYASLTLGSKENNFTINGGWGYYKEEEYNSQSGNSDIQWAFSKKPLFSFNGSVRLSQKVSMLSENWVFPYREYDYNSSNNDYYFKYGSVLSLGIRIMGEKHSFDIAMAVPIIDESIFALPYVGYVFKF